jgi:hypothetical protein
LCTLPRAAHVALQAAGSAELTHRDRGTDRPNAHDTRGFGIAPRHTVSTSLGVVDHSSSG